MPPTPPLDPPTKDFFVSYTRADRDWAVWISSKLEENGYSVILQAWDFLAGGNFVLDMNEATKAKRTIAVLSPAYLKAPFPQTEWAAAFVQDPTGANGTLIPVRVVECTPTGLFRAIGYIDLVGRDEQDALAKLLQGVSRTRAKPAVSPRFPGSSATPASSSSSTPSFPQSAQPSLPWEVLIVDAEEDEAFRIDLEKQLKPLERSGQLTTWHRGKLLAGETFQQGIDKHFYKAKLILLLVSTDFLNSHDCYMLTEEAMKRSNIQEVRVIPVLIRPCYWDTSPFKGLVTIPRNKPISQWSNKDAAYLEVVQEIRKVLPQSITP
jgi:hypothetical protein